MAEELPPHERALPPPTARSSTLQFAIATIVLSVFALIIAVLRIAS